jgi:hypothetical protein
MTALWIVVLLLWVCASVIAAAVLAIWVKLSALAILYVSHTRDDNKHWTTKWEDDADA